MPPAVGERGGRVVLLASVGTASVSTVKVRVGTVGMNDGLMCIYIDA